ncbi:MAG: LEA type 2 family protein [Proteobacteria bacterium]|nr:LEA type 2 family protein [Pseudomonadota bacterium]
MAGPDARRAGRRAVLVALAALPGCAALAPHFERPRLELVGVEVRDATLAEQHLRVRLRVENPNARALPVESIDYALRLGGEEFGNGSSANPFTVPASGSAEFELILTTRLATTLWKVLPRLRDGAPPLEYQLAGTVRTGLAFLRTIPFDERGSIALH